MQRGFLAGTLAAAMAVMPAYSQSPAAKPAPSGAGQIMTEPDAHDLAREVHKYAKENPVIVIGIAKGQKETKYTGDQIGQKFIEILKQVAPDVQAHYIVEPGGDYTGVIFGVNNMLFGPWGLSEGAQRMVGFPGPVDYYQTLVKTGKYPAPIAKNSAPAPEH